ncbi:MAG: glycoside hydrolase family 38 C-terminal domain-containing protein [Oscillospiraceae bacterium]
MLRTAFDVGVQSQSASYDIQYGQIKRPTHTNTSWDMARFEVCGIKWADLSQNDYGVALQSDCKYGYRCGTAAWSWTCCAARIIPGGGGSVPAPFFLCALSACGQRSRRRRSPAGV